LKRESPIRQKWKIQRVRLRVGRNPHRDGCSYYHHLQPVFMVEFNSRARLHHEHGEEASLLTSGGSFIRITPESAFVVATWKTALKAGSGCP